MYNVKIRARKAHTWHNILYMTTEAEIEQVITTWLQEWKVIGLDAASTSGPNAMSKPTVPLGPTTDSVLPASTS